MIQCLFMQVSALPYRSAHLYTGLRKSIQVSAQSYTSTHIYTHLRTSVHVRANSNKFALDHTGPRAFMQVRARPYRSVHVQTVPLKGHASQRKFKHFSRKPIQVSASPIQVSAKSCKSAQVDTTETVQPRVSLQVILVTIYVRLSLSIHAS